ncbi:MAG: hypothetical protein KGK34_02155 [Chloroflexota bacterium]|nr:hypothetical protein [Chloroflexota bacterium]
MSFAHDVGPRLAGGRVAVRGRLGVYFRELQAERRLSDADLLRAGASANQSSLSDYLTGRRYPDPRCFAELVDAFRNAGQGLFMIQFLEVFKPYLEEAPAWDRFTSGQREWVSETRVIAPTRSRRVIRALKNERAKNVRKNGASRTKGKKAAGEIPERT